MSRTKVKVKGIGCLFVPFIYFFSGVFQVIGMLFKGIFNLMFGWLGVRLK